MSPRYGVIVAVALCLAISWFLALRSSPIERRIEPEIAAPIPSAPAIVEPPTPPIPKEAPKAEVRPAEPAPAAPSAAPAPSPEPADPGAPKAQVPARSGPVDELKALFANEPRASTASDAESAIDVAYRRPEVQPGLLKSALCRSSVCRIETRWSPERGTGFLLALMQLVSGQGDVKFEHEFGISPEGEADPDGSHAVDVYVKQAAATAPAAAPASPPAPVAEPEAR